MEMAYGVFGEDILVEILKRLPKKYQFRFRCVSKGWLHLLSDRTRLSPTTTDTGLLLQQWVGPYTSQSFNMTFLRVLNEEDGSAGFIDHSLGFSTEVEVLMLDLCNGLFLLGRCVYRKIGRFFYRDSGRRILEYVVFNPATKRSVRIPNPFEERDVSGHGFAFDGHNYRVVYFQPPIYKVREKWVFHIFSSQTGEWDEKHFTQPSVGRADPRHVSKYTIFLRGAIHWVLSNFIVIYHVKGEYFKLIKLPQYNRFTYSQCIWHSEGCLHYCSGNRDAISIWVLHMEGMDYPHNLPHDVEWRLKHDVVLTTLMPELRCLYPFKPHAFNDDFETLYLENNHRLLSYKLETRVLKQVSISNIPVGADVHPFVYGPVHDFPKQPRVKERA